MATDTDNATPVDFTVEPGFYSESTARGAKGRWKDGNRVRFKDGLPQKMGGWTAQAITGATFQGIDRRDLEWTSLDGNRWLAQGTSKKLYLINNNTRYDITPVRRTITLGANPFTTVNGSPLVTVSDPAHGAAQGDFVRFSGATAVATLTINGEYQITSVVDGNSYVITASGNANAGATGGGAAVVANYDINIGYDSATQARGYGVCGYGQGTFGTRRGTCSSVYLPLRTWSLDNFGEDLIASPIGGAVYWWDRTTGPNARAVVLSNAPATNQYVLISDSGDQIICLGAYDPVANQNDPMFIRTGDVGSLTDFTLSETGANSVFEERLSTGSKIIMGVRTRNGIFIFTDKAQYLMQPDATEVFRIGKISEGSSILGPNAAIEIDGTMYGMGKSRFVAFDGVYQEIPCPVWGLLFDNKDTATPGLNNVQAAKVYCWYNKDFSEIWWHYPSSAASENDRYVILNVAEKLWYFGAIARTTGSSGGTAYTTPFTTDASGVLYLHETGSDDNGAAMGDYIESWDTQISDAKEAQHIRQFIPDMKRIAGTLQLTLKAKNRPQQASYVVYGPYSFTGTDTVVGVRGAGRQIAIRIASTGVGSDWRMGTHTFEVQADAGER
jgi:hypothetical protein